MKGTIELRWKREPHEGDGQVLGKPQNKDDFCGKYALQYRVIGENECGNWCDIPVVDE